MSFFTLFFRGGDIGGGEVEGPVPLVPSFGGGDIGGGDVDLMRACFAGGDVDRGDVGELSFWPATVMGFAKIRCPVLECTGQGRCADGRAYLNHLDNCAANAPVRNMLKYDLLCPLTLRLLSGDRK